MQFSHKKKILKLRNKKEEDMNYQSEFSEIRKENKEEIKKFKLLQEKEKFKELQKKLIKSQIIWIYQSNFIKNVFM